MEQLENKKKTCKIYVNWKDDVNPTEKKGLTSKDFLSFFSGRCGLHKSPPLCNSFSPTHVQVTDL